jgi:hypothetical protein
MIVDRERQAPRITIANGWSGAFHGTRVFTTELTENTEGMRKKAIFGTAKVASSASPL